MTDPTRLMWWATSRGRAGDRAGTPRDTGHSLAPLARASLLPLLLEAAGDSEGMGGRLSGDTFPTWIFTPRHPVKIHNVSQNIFLTIL